MDVINKVYITENVSVITFENVPANISFLSRLFSHVATANINVDMISQTSPKGERNSISFTVDDAQVALVLEIANKVDEKFAEIKTLVSSGNVKISLYGEDMPQKFGVASDVFDKLEKVNIDVMLITTSDVDISLLVSGANGDTAYQSLYKEYIK